MLKDISPEKEDEISEHGIEETPKPVVPEKQDATLKPVEVLPKSPEFSDPSIENLL